MTAPHANPALILRAELEYPGKPEAYDRVAKGRAFGSGKVTTYDPKAAVKERLGRALRLVRKGGIIEGPVALEVIAVYGKKPRTIIRAHEIQNESGMPVFLLRQPFTRSRTKRPDIDNLIKLVMDAGNGTLWRDDSQVAVVIGQKVEV